MNNNNSSNTPKYGNNTTVNQVPEHIQIKLQDALVLYYNLYKASRHPDIGYLDADNHFGYLIKQLFEVDFSVKTEVVEALIWNCVQLDELEGGSQFWHPNDATLDTFVVRLMHHKKFKFYFDKIYNFFRGRKPKQGVPPEAILEQQYQEES